MFAKATSKFVDEIDPGGCLIPVSRPNESDNLTILSLVIKRNPTWFWQTPKYMPTDFTLSDVLLGEKPLIPVLIETDFLKYNRTMENNTAGAAEADIGPGNVNIGGKGLFKLASSFGSLKKQEVDVQKLLHDTKDRRLDLQHSLLRQTQKHRREVFALVKERIITTQTCTVTEEVKGGGTCSAFLGFTLPRKIEVSVKNGTVHSDSNVFIEIPAKAALAYSLMELSVTSKGQFDLCLMPHTSGSFEVDGLDKKTSPTLLCSTPPESPVQKLKEDLDKLQDQFKVLSGLPVSTRSCLFEQITLLLKSKTAISALDLALENLIYDRKSDLSALDKDPSMKKAIQTTLELLKEIEGADQAPLECITSKQTEMSAFTATNVLTSALDGMTESALCVLQSCCSNPTILALHLLVQNITGNKDCSLKDSTLAPLAENDTYIKVQELFGDSDVMLSKEEDLIQAQISSQQGNLPLLLCIAIFSLASLTSPPDEVSDCDRLMVLNIRDHMSKQPNQNLVHK